MFKHKVFASLILLGLLLGILLFLSWVSFSQKKLIAYSADSYGPDGLKAVDLILKKSGYKVNTINHLPAGHQQILMVITTTPLSAGQERAILDWIADGGTVLELTSSWPSIQIGSQAPVPLAASVDQSFIGNVVGDTDVSGLTTLAYHIGKNGVFAVANPEQGLYGIDNRYFIYRQSYGTGYLIHWNDIDGLTNRYLKKFPDNAAVLIILLGMISSSSQVSYYNLAFMTDSSKFNWRAGMSFSHYWGFCLLLFTAVVILLWKLAARFGRPRPLLLAKGRSFDEFVYSMAGLFHQAKIYRMVLDNLWRDLLKIMAELTHLPASTAPDQLVARVNMLTGLNYQSLLQFCPYFDHQNKAFPKQQFLTIALKLDACRKELREWRKSSRFVTR